MILLICFPNPNKNTYSFSAWNSKVADTSPIVVDPCFVLILDQMKTSEKMKKEKMGVFKVLEEPSDSSAECVF